jgi:hypothetical protein
VFKVKSDDPSASSSRLRLPGPSDRGGWRHTKVQGATWRARFPAGTHESCRLGYVLAGGTSRNRTTECACVSVFVCFL